MAHTSEKSLIEKLKSNNSSEVYKALTDIRYSYARKQSKMKILQKYSVTKLIVPFLENPQFCNLSLSIVADACLEMTFVEEIIKYDGIKSLIRIMKSRVNDDIQNRACRALGNIAKFDIGYKAIDLMKPVSSIITFLSETHNANCQKTAVRTLMILGKSPKTREVISQENGIILIAKLLHSDNKGVLNCSIKALSILTKNCTVSCARQLLELEFLKNIVQLYSHSERCIQNHVLISLKNLAMLTEIRAGLVKAGAIKLFTEVLSKLDSNEMSRLAALALCSCLDHIHMWTFNGTDRVVGLKALLVVLQNKTFQDIHLHIISSLIPLSYESKVPDILINLNLLKILFEILSFYIQTHKCRHLANSSFKASPIYKIAVSNTKDEYSEDEILHHQFNVSEHLFTRPEISSPLPTQIKSINCINFDVSRKNLILSERLTDVHSFTKLDSTFNSVSPSSDYSSSHSPNRMLSPIRKVSTSPEAYYELDSPPCLYSPDLSSSKILTDEDVTAYETCWYPVIPSNSSSISSEHSNSFTNTHNSEDSEISSFSSSQFSNSRSDQIDNVKQFDNSSSKEINYAMPCDAQVVQNENLLDIIKTENKLNHIKNHFSRKRLKTENFNANFEKINNKSNQQQSAIIKNKSLSMKLDINKSILNSASKLYNENKEIQTIDQYILTLIFQLSFHIEKNPNTQLADECCFIVLIEYLILIHNPSPKAETILFNLLTNRYCFEKLIINGFISKVEEKMSEDTSTYSCDRHSNIKLFYSKLINKGRQEAASEYGIGTLSHILVTSEKTGQLHAVFAVSKLVTEKASLYKLLFYAHGLTLLLNFLSDSCISIRRKAILSLRELYQSLTKEQNNEKCSTELCDLHIKNICSYKKSFYNITFLVDSGAKILANREKLCENSEYFSALLDGYFLETHAEHVLLPDISAENLSTVFHFLHGCESGDCCVYIKRIPFSVLIELLSDCDRFLLNNVKSFVEDRLRHCFHMCPSTIPKIYTKSKIHNSPGLSRCCLDFALTVEMVEKDILYDCFEELINLDSNFNFHADIENLMKSTF